MKNEAKSLGRFINQIYALYAMSEKIQCPKCGAEATFVSESNPIRNVTRSTISCRNCGYNAVREHPSDISFKEWLAKK